MGARYLIDDPKDTGVHCPTVALVMSAIIKICGLSTPETLETAIAAGADLVGFVHFPRSPRHVTVAAAAALAAQARGRSKIVCLLVDPDDQLIDAIVTAALPDYLQLHGSEMPSRVADVAQRWGVPVIKAVKVATAEDAALADDFRDAAAFLLFDAKPLPGETSKLPGGNGIAFDWRVIDGQADKGPFMLSGGLDPDNVAEAIRFTGAPMVDVSSGVESAPGVKDNGLIRRFVNAARGAGTPSHG